MPDGGSHQPSVISQWEVGGGPVRGASVRVLNPAGQGRGEEGRREGRGGGGEAYKGAVEGAQGGEGKEEFQGKM